MSADRELLEMAAKAAGLRVVGLADDAVVFPGIYAGGLSIRNGRGGDSLWNPITDDGDALRLAAALLIDIEWETEWIVFASGNFSEDIKDHGNDRAATVRRAVVRAAAFQGESIP